MKKISDKENGLLESIVSLIETARQRVALAVNSELTLLYWNIGKQINDELIKNGRADYGMRILADLSHYLSFKFGDGFSKRNLHNFVKFSEVFPNLEIVHSLRAQLSWTHIRQLIYVEDELKREFYTQLCIYERWSVRTLQERIGSMLFERTPSVKSLHSPLKTTFNLLKNENKISLFLSHSLDFK